MATRRDGGRLGDPPPAPGADRPWERAGDHWRIRVEGGHADRLPVEWCHLGADHWDNCVDEGFADAWGWWERPAAGHP